jgi:pimeloyl-ACP methyl ester carboxylesterase
MRVIDIDGVRLHVMERGAGPPVVFVHMGGADIRYWRTQLPAFAERGWRAIAYSRRFAWPNDNPMVGDYSPHTDAADLEALLGVLHAAPAHIVAGSIGAFASLVLAVRRPELVRSLVLAEPPIVAWARESAEGAAVAAHFDREVWRPTRAAFREGDAERAMATLLDHFVGPGALAALPERTRRRIMENARDWEAHTLSSLPFPAPDPDDVRRLAVPVLMLSGERTLPLHRIVDARLESLLPDVTRVVVPGATHDLWAERGEFCRERTVEFLERVSR